MILGYSSIGLLAFGDFQEGFDVFGIQADAASFTFTGFDAQLHASFSLTASAGEFNVGGQPAASVRNLVADVGSFTLTGQDSGSFIDVRLSAATGTFTLSGQAVTLSAVQFLTAEAGEFALTGQDAFRLLARGVGLRGKAGGGLAFGGATGGGTALRGRLN